MGWTRVLRALAIVGAGVLAMGAGDAGYLSVCAQCMSARIYSASGFGTANAVAEAKVGIPEARDWCANWQPGDGACLKEAMKGEEYGKVVKIQADCTAGRITIDGETYRYAGVWDNSDIGGGRSKWRGAGGQIVGRSNAENGLMIAANWETVCPKGLVRAPTASAAPALRAPPVTGAAFSVGQTVEAKYMSGWVRGRVTRLRPSVAGVDYEVELVNGQRGIVPARMLRSLAP